jgi:outer membrane receptor protein involved in Fe transport
MGRSVRRKFVLSVVSCCATAGLAGQATAQPSTPAPPQAEGTSGTAPHGKTGRVEEIVVTSQKRSENVRKVPLSVTVLSGAQIKAAHIQHFADLTRAVPNLSFSSQAGEGLATLELRGIASQAGTATVALYLDDVSLTTRNLSTEGTAEPRFVDIARVEVLRGPQSTLYGASALGGTLRYISNQPKMNVFEGNISTELSGTYHGTLNWDELATLNIPLVQDKMVLRISGETGGDGGYISNVNPANGALIKDNINSNGFNVVRGTLLWTPTDWLTITPSTFFQRAITRDVDAVYLSLPNDQTPKKVAEPGRDTLIVPSLTVNADLGFANLIAVTGNYERQFTRTLDSTIYNDLSLYVCDPQDTAVTCTDANGNPVYGAPPGLYNALHQLPSETFYSNTVRQWSQEVRLVSKPYVPGELPFTWIAGLYYSDEHTTATDTEFVRGANAAFTKYNANILDPTVILGGFPGAIVNDQVFQGIRSYDTAQYAVFGEGTYYPAPNIRLTAGARYQYSRDGEGDYQGFYYSYGDNGLTTSVGHFYSFTPKFAAGWDVTPTNTLYANVSKGFRLGSENRRLTYIPDEATASGTPSFDLAQLGLHAAPTSFGPDKLWNFEVGDKARLFGGRLVANTDAFYILWSDIQQNIPLVTSGLEFETNAGSATSYGLEFEFRGQVNDDLTLSLSGSWTHATLDHGVEINGNLVNGTFPGEKVPGVPDYNFNFNARQNFQVSDAITGFASITPAWIGESHGDVVTTNPDYKRPSYITLDASAGIDVGRWEFTIFGENLTNNNKIIQRPDIQGSASSLYGLIYEGNAVRNVQGFTLRPLTVGMNAALKF